MFTRRHGRGATCRDAAHRRRKVEVRGQLDAKGDPQVAVALDGGEWVTLDALETGRLRGLLADSLLAADELARLSK